ncbi:putative Dolichyl-diphosphooligosaccharide--protein glycosyltransferase subunit DAD1 [Glarea lozoyensis 74030]|uniref:Dolichyl-diphosphooligosaccharide--protein glycosyltransferase subunit OST2 n=1 Tax=Glarea lozoyensis (strain ATCC 74030 / MF5533) TaxID=1104152 RepID=H0ECX2_GLAL7|nr:putative Dolichyl-diphosphooligosaccharide--protein glycosyltransferase subunit DAD1 [Glarea lozoyensis 74030]
MAPKRSQASAVSRESTPSATVTQTVPASTPIRTANKNQSPAEIALGIWENYLDKTPQRTKLIDVFMAFLVVPFNAFLSGFSATVGQFVLTASLRIQTNVENKADFTSVSQERAFADYVFGSLILHFFCVNFIN